MHTRRLAVLLTLLLVTAAVAWDGQIITYKPFSDTAVTTNITSAARGLGEIKPTGYFSLQLSMAGTGTLNGVYYQISNDGATFVTPSSGAALTTNFTAASGTDIFSFAPPLAAYLRFYITHTGANASTVTATVAIQ